MNKKTITAPVPSLSTRVLAGFVGFGETLMECLSAFYCSVLQENISNKQALWMTSFGFSFCAFLIFICTGCYLLAILAAVGTLISSKRSGLKEYE